jgi:segregation and condensation protein B
MINAEAIEQIEDEIIEAEVAVEVEEEQAPLIPLDDPAQQKRLIEALLFASPEPIKLRAIQSRLPDTADVGFILTQLQGEYAERGIQLIQLEDAWAFRTAPDIGPQLAINKKEEKRLSRAALETLSIIAYHQPVTRAEVENIRGVATNKGTLDVLMEAGWIKPGRRLETPGRPVTWITTTQFLDDFGVSDLNDLPGLAELKASGLLDTRPAIDTIPGARDLFSASNENNPEEGSETSIDENGEFDQKSDDRGQDEVEPEDENKIEMSSDDSDEDDDDDAYDEDDSDEDDDDDDSDDDEDDDEEEDK